jgi:transcriptional regulator with XRE-family HTH domain
MAKPELRIKARELRKNGLSLNEIVEKLGVSKSSASLWCRDIELTKVQVERLDEKAWSGGMVGRLKGAEANKKKRLDNIKKYRLKGEKYYFSISEREFMAAGLALYLGEGNKRGNVVGFCNSDLKIVKFMKLWFMETFDLKEEEFIYRVRINYIHRDRDEKIKNYWINELNIPKDCFRKTTFIKTENKKKYENRSVYYGTLKISVRKSSKMLYKIWGFSDALLDVKLGRFDSLT